MYDATTSTCLVITHLTLVSVDETGLLARGGSRKLSSSTEIQEILREEGMPSLAVSLVLI